MYPSVNSEHNIQLLAVIFKHFNQYKMFRSQGDTLWFLPLYLWLRVLKCSFFYQRREIINERSWELAFYI